MNSLPYKKLPDIFTDNKRETNTALFQMNNKSQKAYTDIFHNILEHLKALCLQ
jgi:hypothetical protein